MKASGKIVPIFVDCNWGESNKDLSDKYNVEGYPTVIFTNPDGKQLAGMGDDRAEGLNQQSDEIAAKFPGGPPVPTGFYQRERAEYLKYLLLSSLGFE